MKRFNRLIYGLVLGTIVPALFIYIYIARFYPGDATAFEVIKILYPGAILSKLVMLSAIPDLLLTFLFYKSDSFRIAAGTMIGGIAYFVASMFML